MFQKHTPKIILFLVAILAVGFFVVKKHSPLSNVEAAFCGDAILDPGEQCDDGNMDDGDGCSATCMVEFLPNGNETKIWAPDGVESDHFGYSVSISGDYAVVGASMDDIDANSDQGSAYVFYKDPVSGWVQQAKLTAGDGAADDQFGYAVSISGNTVVVGAPYDDVTSADQGSAYVFVKPVGGWSDMQETAKLTATLWACNNLDNHFGHSVSVDGDTIAVGEPNGDMNPGCWPGGTDDGAVYVFEKPGGGWVNMTQTARLNAIDFLMNDHLGYSVAISGDTIVAGATGEVAYQAAGVAYIYVKPAGGWSGSPGGAGIFDAKLKASDGVAHDHFGESVSFSGDTIVIGAPHSNANQGSAYIFEKPVGGWSGNYNETVKLTANDGMTDDQFGKSVSIFGDYAIVNAVGDDDMGDDSGSVYVFYKDWGGADTWGQFKKILATDETTGDAFGTSVSISGYTMVAGSPQSDITWADQGAAYIYVNFTCGNSVIEGAEECDDGGESVTCDNDCTFVSCGDGNFNATAGEGCDDGNLIDGDGCDSSCVAEFCGDGIIQAGLNEQCDDGNTVDGDSCASICQPEVCGDGIPVPIEECDDGNLIDGDGCDANCNFETVCGNGVQEPGEECDDGDDVTGNGCSSTCVSEYCGDGIIQEGLNEVCDDGNGDIGDGCGNCQLVVCGDGIFLPPEQCDDGNLIDGDGCTSACIAEYCGDGIDNNGTAEACDDGNWDNGDGCSATCQFEVCGDGILVTIEQCDDGNLIDGDGCTSTCIWEYCGDGIIQEGIGEVCDDGNQDNGDGCSFMCCSFNCQGCPNNTCQLEICGDGILVPIEQCDDGNLIDGDGCTSACIAEVCGDGVDNNGTAEACDDGNGDNGDGCSSACQFEVCGDGILVPFEECDDGNFIDGDGCTSACIAEYCGDGIDNNGTAEACDDGNGDNGDGCSSTCQFEVCGDGILVPIEQCDDGNTQDNDGCSSACRNECGDGVKQINEGCDDGNLNNGDGCASTCQQEVCGDGILVPFEQCDDGNLTDGDGCSSACWSEICDEKKLSFPSLPDNAEAGFQVHISGDYAVVGVPNDNARYHNNEGAAYIFKRSGSGWNRIKKLMASDGIGGDRFGQAVNIDGDYVVVGAPYDYGAFYWFYYDMGSAYVFYKNEGGTDNWGQVKKLTPGNNTRGDRFGWSVDISGDYMVVGAIRGSFSHYVPGSAYVFYNDPVLGWTEQQELTANDGDPQDEFGNSVAIFGDRAIIGAQNESSGLFWRAGAAYIFERTGASWNQQAKLVPSDRVSFTLFGESVDINDDYVAIGLQSNHNPMPPRGGAVYIFEELGGNWTQTAKLTQSDANLFEEFLSDSVSISDDYVYVGASRHDVGLNPVQGSVYIFKKPTGGWTDMTETAKFTASDGAADDEYGNSIAVDGSRIIIGSHFKGDNNAGGAYLYDCETEGGGGSSAPAPAVCIASTVKLDMPSTLPVSQIGGRPVVTLNWKGISAEDITDLNTRILFDYFSQSRKPAIGTGGKFTENVFARYALDKIAGDADLLSAFKTYLGKVGFESLSDCECNNDEARLVVSAVRSLMGNPAISDKAKSLVTGFMNDLLALERILSETGKEASTPFTDFYMAGSGVTSAEGITVNIYRNGNLIHSETDPSDNSYTDNTVPANDSGMVKYYSYYIVTENKCGETAQGATGQARIDPAVPDGTTVQVSLDLAIKVREGYSQLFMEKLKELLMVNGTTPQYTEGQVQEGACEDMRQAFLTEKKTDMMFPYILECFAGYDYLLRQKLEENRANIVPPLLKLLQLNEGKETRENIVEQFMYPLISRFNDEINLQMTLKAGIGSLNLTASSVINLTDLGQLTQSQMDEIRKIDEAYFGGAGHAADLTIEKYDLDNNLVGTYPAHTDVFGIAKGVPVGDMTAGKDYTLKIKLKDAKYTLPKIVEVNVGSAVKTGSVYSTVISLNFTKHFRYGDFNEDGKIDLQDIIAWGGLLGERPDLWSQGDIDGLYGIDLLDVVTLQGNWGGVGDAMREGGTMSIADLLSLFGLALSPSVTGGGETTVAVPEWIDILTTDC